MPISSWSTTAADNDDADSASGITWPEGMNPNQVNNSARAMMAEIKGFYDNTVLKTGGTMTGSLVIPIGSAAAPSISFAGDDNTGMYQPTAETIGWATGGTLRAYMNTTGFVSVLPFYAPDGDAASPGIAFTTGFTTGLFQSGGSLGLSASGAVRLFVTTTATHPGLDNTYSCGASGFRWNVVYATTGTINTSDATQKTEAELSDGVLRAVYRVPLKAFKWNDALASKGEAARTHYGYFAQDVAAELIAEGIDPATQGFWCIDTLEDGSTRQGLRYEEFATIRKEAERRVSAGILAI